jgi:DNA-binding NarL/FixJ family response regulator
MRVLLADDSDLIIERLKEILNTFDCLEVIACVKNGIQTLEALKNLKPDIAIVDIKMPGLNGLEVLSKIRKENRDIKIIILTFYSSEYYRMLADRDGADYFFNKADEFDKVSAAIEDIILRANINTEIETIDLK